ncbi:hypothetical protein GCM10008090_00300 [Arenicella chitinivorans]|uniref:TonB C-terminal domain-containing protein n=2 Tax=Arenicella chitinivorans TaxID=1329800 RepID=A0A918RFN3_9GAMM|nr:hypothetical protein GCM10008090_00300 [Arenicella chitinivorans]
MVWQWLSLVSLLALSLALQTAIADGLSEGVYTAAEHDHRPPPKYPSQLERSGKPGAVAVSYMIDEAGKTYDVKVLRSTHVGFEKSAVEVVEQYTFSPALLAGQPVRSRKNSVVYYEMAGVDRTKLSAEFQRHYRYLIGAMEKGETSDKKFKKRFERGYNAVRSPCDYIYYYLAQSHYYQTKQYDDRQITALRHLKLYEADVDKDGWCLTPKMHTSTTLDLVALLYIHSDVGGATAEFERLVNRRLIEVDQFLLPELKQVVDNPARLLPTQRKITVGGRGFHVIELFANRFSVSRFTNDVDQLKLECDTGEQVLDPEVESHRIEAPLSGCQLVVRAKPGTQFQFAEMSD